MGFPSPAQDYAERRISLDELCIIKPAATYFMKAGHSAPSVGIVQGAVLVVDASLKPSHGSVVCTTVDGELAIRRYLTRPVRGLAELEPPHRFTPVVVEDDYLTEDRCVWGVVTWWLTPAGAL